MNSSETHCALRRTVDKLQDILLVLLITVVASLVFVQVVLRYIVHAPLLLPLVKAIGIDPIHFAAIMGVNLVIGGVTPPYASILYLGMRVGDVEVTDILGPAMMFVVLGYLPVMIMTSFWPALSLWLPSLLGYVVLP